ncbi:hypothetical protein BN59_01642 [Legionella massiliensis]|uniref:Uncharacterized protein n=1 Tax=Legionella massiliensis TaxID=1034943 RepID=A0A078KZX0_9GAMM|nr:hypothetical protein [Legionella massiliensis]CDZ77359.1 hypothetical protein BN59_01642 [Legionella massiliensis]CEE13097.1 hypothetical protein BN1094_01642 [Legionella massiliensis]
MYRREEKGPSTFFQGLNETLLPQNELEELEESKQSDYPTYIVGNDPVITGLDNYKSDKKMGLIATGGLRSILFALQLNNSNETPQIILIDNSKSVCKFWRELKKFVELKETEDSFLSSLPQFFQDNASLCYNHIEKEGVSYQSEIFDSTTETLRHNQNPQKFLEAIISEFGYESFRSTLIEAKVINQSWTNRNTFVQVMKVLQQSGIENTYMYPSNIFAYMQFDAETSDDAPKVLENIALVNPKLCIHTDLHSIFRTSAKAYLVEAHNPEEVKELLAIKQIDITATIMGFSW